MNEIRLFWHELESMPEYSLSVPSGTTLWKMWRRKEWRSPDGQWRGSAAIDAYYAVKAKLAEGEEPVAVWLVGQYWPCRHHGAACELHVTIRWFEVVLKHGPAPPVYRAPDWENYERWKQERRLHSFPKHNGASDA